MAKPAKSTSKVFIATRTIHAGTPAKPEIFAPGEEVDLPADIIKDLLDRGAIREEAVRGKAVSEESPPPPPGGGNS